MLWPALLAGLHLASASTIDRVAAVVNDEVISLSEVYELGGDFIEERAAQAGGDGAARRRAELEVLDTQIRRSLITQEMSRLDIAVTEADLDAAVSDIAHRNGLSQDQLRVEVERTGLGWAAYREELRESLREQKFQMSVIYPRITVNDDELRDAWRRLANSAERPEVVELGAITLRWPAGADDAAKQALLDQAAGLVARVRAGEDFAAVSAEADQGPYGASGGRMGTYHQGELMESLDGPAFALQPGQVSDPVSLPVGVFVLYCFDRKAESLPAFEDMKGELFNQVYATRIEDEVVQWTEQARRRASVIIKLEQPDAK